LFQTFILITIKLKKKSCTIGKTSLLKIKRKNKIKNKERKY